MIIVKYEEKNFWGATEFRMDKKYNPKYEDIKKVFRFLKQNYRHSIEIRNVVLYWDTMEDFEYGTLTARQYTDAYNYDEFSWDYDGCKKSYYDMYKKAENEEEEE